MSERLDVLVCYDVETVSEGGKARLRRMANACKAYGQRVQYSVFELSVTPTLLERFVQRAQGVMDERTDSLRIYILAGDRERYLRVYGRDGWVDFEGTLVI